MAYPIRKLSFGEIFDQSFRLMRELFVPYALMVLAAFLVTEAAQLGLSELSATGGAFTFIAGCVWFGLYLFVDLVVTVAAVETYVGRPTTFAAALARTKPIFTPYMGTTLLMGLGLLVSLLLVVPAIYFFVVWGLLGPICVLEGRFGSAALRRSRELVRGHFWRTFALITIGLGANVFATLGFNLLLASVPIAAGLLDSATSALITVFITHLTVVIYIDLRCRREDFDLELLAREVAGTGQGPTPPSAGGSGAAAA